MTNLYTHVCVCVCYNIQASPYAAMLAAQDVAALCKERGITALHIKMRASGGTKYVHCLYINFSKCIIALHLHENHNGMHLLYMYATCVQS